jgi:alpha-L-rhamnosidase
LADNIQDAFNSNFFNKNKGIYEELPSPEGYSSLQTANLLPLEFEIVPEIYIKNVLQNIINDINIYHNGHLSTGIIGTKSMMEVLPKYNFQKLLFDIIHQKDYPGFGYWVYNGATTIWQNWSDTGDHMHAMYGTVEEFNFNHVLGIRSPNNGKTTPGFKHIHIEPWVNGEISWAKGFLESPHGKISVNWMNNGKNLIFKVNIPVNSNATIVLPAQYSTIYESNNLLTINNPSEQSNNDHIQIHDNSQKLKIRISSGQYSFMLQKSY